ncbi:histidine kinase [Paenibacillus sp. J5C_2022]|uniref:sensor histidine kinase n=1 Tax=Paenibacillus sp. J5C2022 TaxID=2977129 RepID=UPI0021D130A5|nr:histidine kinase [Paenibacillus sp. J5C2022]MCU6709696.1 histidine kinase [Paenibacillus sp. J5C2022]
MKHRRSLGFKLSVVFAAAAVPLLLFLIYINRYAMDVVRTQVAESQQSLLSMHANDMDAKLTQVNHYLLGSAFQHAGITSLMLNEQGSDEYTLTKIQVLNQMNKDMANYKNVAMLFVYATQNEDLMTTEPGINVSKTIREELAEVMRSSENRAVFLQSWQVVELRDSLWLMRLEQNDFNVYTGALISASSLMEPIQNVMAEGEGMGQVLLLNETGQLLHSVPPASQEAAKGLHLAKVSGKLYDTILVEGDKTLVVEKGSIQSDMRLVALLPESRLLQRLVTFQTVINLMPFAAAILLLLLLVILRRVVLKPIVQLVRGMRKIKDGDLAYRLEHSATMEFEWITGNFNEMVSEIKDLKINVYEEQLRLSKAEIRQLQLQIHPHFLLNSLNVVFHLIQSGEIKLAQRMIRYIMDYFRFVTRSAVAIVRLEDEIQHIVTYLEIQKMRFPQFLDFEVVVDDKLKEASLPAVLFQPFVENAIIHGFRIRRQRFIIQISVESDPDQPDGGLMIRIMDNGTGFEGDQLRAFANASFKHDQEHLGIGNVYERLRMHYGARATLLFGNKPEGGAEVTMRIPLQFHID